MFSAFSRKNPFEQTFGPRVYMCVRAELRSPVCVVLNQRNKDTCLLMGVPSRSVATQMVRPNIGRLYAETILSEAKDESKRK